MVHDPEINSDLVDVADLSLEELADLPDTVLRASLRRVLAAPDSEAELFSMFSNSS